jgi:tripartite-type tricarboxylate transporter receptor subunit TctC
MHIVRFAVLLLGLACGPLLDQAVAADKYPSRPIKFVVGFLAGGPTDTTARIFCEWLSQHLGTCVVENKVGQGGMIAAASVANAPGDGYSILFIGPNNFIGPTLYKNLSFNHLRDTVPVAGLARLSNVMVVPPTFPAKTVAEFIAYAKANPGKISYASSGNGTSVHMSAELFKMMTKLDMVHVPYKGSAGIYPDLLTGKVDVLFDNLPGVLEFSRAGKLRALAVTTAKRQPSLPDVPTVAETVPGYEATVIYGVAASKGTPPEAVQILNKAFNDALADPTVQKRLADLGSEPLPMTSAEFGKLTGDEIDKWGKVVKAANLSIE